MDLQDILSALRVERGRIDAALAALGNGKGGNRRSGAHGTRTLSAAARRKISQAAKVRWAKAKKAGRNSL